MANNELLIKINADAKNAKKAFDDIRDQTEDLEAVLSKTAKISAVAFAAFTAEIYLSVRAFEEAEKASVQLTNALQNQGIFTEDLKNQYEEFAQVVQAKTGIDNDAVIQAQAVAQTFLGQTVITQELTNAIADLGASMGGDLAGAAEKIGRTIGTNTNAFVKQGLVLRETATEAERHAAVLEFVRIKAGGLAADLNVADGFAKALSTSFGNFQESIGSRFAPLVAGARKLLIGFFDLFTNNKLLGDFAVALLAGGAAVTGLIALVGAAVPAFLALQAAAAAFGVAFNLAFAGIPILIGAAVAAITLLALNWDKATAAMIAAATGAVVLIGELFGGLGDVLVGVFTFDPKLVDEGVRRIADSVRLAKDTTVALYKELSVEVKAEGEKQDEEKKKAAARAAEIERRHQANLRAIRAQEFEIQVLQHQNASQAIIDLKRKELEILKALDQEHTQAERSLLEQRYRENQALQEEQNAEDIEKFIEFAHLQAEVKAEFAAQGIEVDTALREEKLAELRATAATEADIERKLQEDLLKSKIDARNKELEDRKRYGASYAAINKALNSDEITATKSAADSFVALSQSKNTQLKEIGKAAAKVQIGIDTAKGAMAVYANFQTAIPYPPVSIPLGLAAAAALTLYGAERISQVQGAAEGGLITGGIPGVDSVPVLAQQGELIAPAKNFDEVVGAVRTQREGGNDEVATLLREINDKFSNPQTTIIQGDVTTDDSFIDTLVKRINDAVELRNQRLTATSVV